MEKNHAKELASHMCRNSPVPGDHVIVDLVLGEQHRRRDVLEQLGLDIVVVDEATSSAQRHSATYLSHKLSNWREGRVCTIAVDVCSSSSRLSRSSNPSLPSCIGSLDMGQ